MARWSGRCLSAGLLVIRAVTQWRCAAINVTMGHPLPQRGAVRATIAGKISLLVTSLAPQRLRTFSTRQSVRFGSLA